MKHLHAAFKKMGEAHAHMDQHMKEAGVHPEQIGDQSEEGEPAAEENAETPAMEKAEMDAGQHGGDSPAKEKGFRGSKLPMKHKGMF